MVFRYKIECECYEKVILRKCLITTKWHILSFQTEDKSPFLMNFMIKYLEFLRLIDAKSVIYFTLIFLKHFSVRYK